MRGHDLERCNEALEVTTKVLAYKTKHIPKIVETIWTEAQNYFVMTNFPTTDQGPMGPLFQLQDLFLATQLQLMAANDIIYSLLSMANVVVPKDMEMMWLQETLMRSLIELDERARLAKPGERDELS